MRRMDNLKYSKEVITILADNLLNMKPDPIPEYILLTEFKNKPKTSREVQNLYDKILVHPFIKQIQEEQDGSGCWRDFHGYSEQVIRKCLFMGLDESFSCLSKVSTYLEKVLDKTETWHQREEKQDNPKWWLEMFMPLVSATYLSLINPKHPKVAEYQMIWKSFAIAGFKNQQYDPVAESKEQLDYFNIKTKRIIPFFNYYVILLLTASKEVLPVDIDEKMLNFCMNLDRGIYYIYDKSPIIPVTIDNIKNFYSWTRCISILSRYQNWDKYQSKIDSFLWEQRNADGLWDFMKNPYGSLFPLSDSWRKEKNRVIDSSIYVLRLMNQWKGY